MAVLEARFLRNDVPIKMAPVFTHARPPVVNSRLFRSLAATMVKAWSTKVFSQVLGMFSESETVAECKLRAGW